MRGSTRDGEKGQNAEFTKNNRGIHVMTHDASKDWLVEVLNDMDTDTETHKKENTFPLCMVGGSQFEIECR